MPLSTPLAYFKRSEFQHPELVDDRAAVRLDQLRAIFGRPIVLTDDGRPHGVVPPGGSLTSLHYLGRAFDLRTRLWTPSTRFEFVRAVAELDTIMRNTAPAEAGIELELVQGPTDQHFHVGFYLDGRLSELKLRLD